MDRPPFDGRRAAFLLVAGVVLFQCAIVLFVTIFCSWFSIEKNLIGQCESLRSSIGELLTGALAAALAFAASYTDKSK